uniref:NYN domain-containing protein n=1 Tax=Ananas comosus var. bracteatus TaxID=296719 RepID=A0A6V7PA82_ANACO|nr:unnamed protein product [Ananas comosus var. bracteatus]
METRKNHSVSVTSSSTTSSGPPSPPPPTPEIRELSSRSTRLRVTAYFSKKQTPLKTHNRGIRRRARHSWRRPLPSPPSTSTSTSSLPNPIIIPIPSPSLLAPPPPLPHRRRLLSSLTTAPSPPPPPTPATPPPRRRRRRRRRWRWCGRGRGVVGAGAERGGAVGPGQQAPAGQPLRRRLRAPLRRLPPRPRPRRLRLRQPPRLLPPPLLGPRPAPRPAPPRPPRAPRPRPAPGTLPLRRLRPPLPHPPRPQAPLPPAPRARAPQEARPPPLPQEQEEARPLPRPLPLPDSKYDDAARQLLTPRSGYGLAAELRRAGVAVRTVEDKPQAADAALKRQMQHSMARGVDWLVLVSDDSGFAEMLRKAKEAELRTVVIGDGRRALGRAADIWLPWARVESGEIGEDALRSGRQRTNGEFGELDQGLYSNLSFYKDGGDDAIELDSDLDLDGVVDGIVARGSGFGGSGISAFSEEELVDGLDEDEFYRTFGRSEPGKDLLWHSEDGTFLSFLKGRLFSLGTFTRLPSSVLRAHQDNILSILRNYNELIVDAIRSSDSLHVLIKLLCAASTRQCSKKRALGTRLGVRLIAQRLGSP